MLLFLENARFVLYYESYVCNGIRLGLVAESRNSFP